MALLPDFDHTPLGQCVDDRSPDPVQTTRHLVRLFVEFSTGVQHSHHHLDPGFVLSWVIVHWNAVAIVRDAHAPLPRDSYLDERAAPDHGLVHAVVDDLLDQFVQTAFTRITDVHGRTLAHPFQTLENLNGVCRILRGGHGAVTCHRGILGGL